MYKVLLAVGDYSARLALKSFLELNNFSVVEAPNGAFAIRRFKDDMPEAAILDLKQPDTDGINVFRKMREVSEEIPIILLSGNGETNLAQMAVIDGAYDYFPKPLDIDRLLFVLTRSIKAKVYSKGMNAFNNTVNSTLQWHLGSSESMKKTIIDIETVAHNGVSVNIHGEEGTGKSFIARIIHQYGSMAEMPFIHINAESAFKGRKGAPARVNNLFRQADGGTIYLQNLQNISPGVAANLISVITEMANNGKASGPNVRIIASSPVGLNASDRFKKHADQFLFIDWFVIVVPPLVQRVEDIPGLANKFIADIADEMNLCVKEITKEALKRLLKYQWPGNVRELKSAVRRAVIVSDGMLIRAEHFDFLRHKNNALPKMSLKDKTAMAVKDTEIKVILKALDLSSGHKTLAASMLGVSRKTLWEKLKEHGITA
ncbi:MAG: sigma-54-dependent Fis family transcriptional regulator [Nitrospirae bacterium]|nr:sigma-54-dependent Fis family transcriptional regulator [Nitrospirota bacterium]